ncbi:hypothetical protein [Saccharopolyspora mangrovi]|uniref:Uncharacterized protein n=1 Tax=Saccharopolyspora mangrovi TaxID=3082379 RepID=A0ABU6AEX5_9PSEU|nr:hypothetical protein [Saccharopolyspora sp. S2-29]MEB3370103.1 hypothetical protein [Saccharopolyspora sp. S2-29]
MRLRRGLTSAALVLVAFSAAPAAEAAEPAVVVPTCAAVVEGAAGAEVMVLPQALVEPVATAVQGVVGLPGVAEAFRAEWSAAPPISVGRIGEGHLSGGRIADAAIARLAETPAVRAVLGGLAPVVHATLSPVCGIVTHVEIPDLPRLPLGPAPMPPQPAEPPPPPAAPPSQSPEPPAVADQVEAGAVPRAEQRAPQEWPWAEGRRVVGDLEPGSGEPEMSAARTELTASRTSSVADEGPLWLFSPCRCCWPSRLATGCATGVDETRE